MKTTLKILGLMFLLLLTTISFQLGCSKYNETNLKYIEKQSKIKYLSSGELVYYYNGINKIVSDGYKYYIIKFDHKPLDLLEQGKPENDNSRLFEDNTNLEIEQKFENAIDYLNQNEDFLPQYAPNFQHSYAYMTSCNPYYAFYDYNINILFLLYETSFMN